MPLFKMAKENPKDKSKGKGTETEEGEKTLPPRPGTSGTENVLITTRRQASEQFQKAARAEKAYRAKKRATLARHNYNETKSHFKEGFSHLVSGFKGLFSAIKNIPYLFAEKQEARRKKREAAKRQRDLEMKKKLEEALARQNTNGEEDEEAK